MPAIGILATLSRDMRKTMSRISITILLLIFMTSESKAQTPSTALPIQKVELYSSGVGYFEHEGQVNGSATSELRFRSEQMNDVLKSLLLQDLDGGRISTVVYPSLDPINKILSSFDIDLSGNPSLGNVLTQMRGSSVTIQAGTDVHKGIILGVEQITRVLDGATVVSDAINIIEGSKIKSLSLAQIDGIELNDPALQQEFSKALQAVAQARDQDKKPLLISHEGNGRRRIRVGYVVEAPVWKTSYRLVLPEEGEDKGYLQGWSIIENQTENDWENVELTLISGRPISFIQDLYNPLYVQRPVVKFELQENLKPQMYARGMRPEADEEAEGMADAMGAAMNKSVASRPSPVGRKRSAMNSVSSIQSAATTAEVGELFQYIIGSVSLPRQRSAMIPIVTEEIKMQRVSIFNAAVQPRHPLHGMRIENGTKVHLMQGPATVLDGGSYAGDARLNELPTGSKQLISYALDFEMQVDVDQKNSSTDVQTARIVNGVLETQRKQTSEVIYTMNNESQKKRSVVIEHPRKQKWELRDTDEPMEVTATHKRFLVDVDPSSTKAFTVNEEQINSQSVHLTSLDVSRLTAFATGGKIPDGVKKALTKAIELRRKVQQSEAQMQLKNQQLNEITEEQERIRENMGSVERNSSYYKRLLTKLESQEDQIEGFQKEINDLQRTKTKQQQDLQDYLRRLNVN